MKDSTFRWTNDLDTLRTNMTRGHGFYGEPYWDEEETYLVSHYGEDAFADTLCLGCGFFREYEALRTITRQRLVGLDIEQDLVHWCHQQVIGSSAKGDTHVLAGNAMTLPLARESFELVTMLFQTFGNIPDKRKALKEMARVCAPGGEILISVWRSAPKITAFRADNYGLPGADVKLMHDDEGMHRIDVVKDGVPVFSSHIVTDEWIADQVSRTDGLTLEAAENLSFCQIFKIRKTE